ncbi:Cytochrome P450 monooxygenase [Lachnellula hyalina]|uniref:Cytochrome P450 monooxygenase n=1 Tax=Lachnellula hyalina TaxID=1316788 RepID=A0A8H8R1R4_9HELO|nr:Cytochrome P450 monooxygenase [Lachnellula hyalina]TVY26853.1 Cytochrome P450 monooxygenase [Lachnellula hyalina]
MAQPPPDLKIPSSTTTVNIRIIDTTSRISGIPLEGFVSPAIKGHTLLTAAPAFSFLIEHPSNRKLLFDLGDPSTFDSHTALIVGPGFKDAFTPGYPANEESPIRESDYKNRELREISFDQGLKIGRFNAFDYFGDGSFYLLDSPGHAIGHVCGLARVTANTFIFMGGDACHHAGEFRPSQYLPLPSSISPNPLSLGSSTPCPGSLFEDLYRDGDGTKPFYTIAKGGGAIAHDADEAERTIGKVMEADARDEVLVVMAHDDTLLDVVDFFPKYANDFKEKGWVEKGRWLFLKDFAGAVKS